MKKSLRIFLCLFWAVTFGTPVSATTGKPLFLRTVHVAGIITDAASFSPIDNAKVYDDKGLLIASTDAKGYFNGTFRIAAEGEVRFRIKIEKKGYSSFTQTEHWADYGNSVSGMYYIGMKAAKSAAGIKAFSEMRPGRNLSYDSVYEELKHVKDKIRMDNTLEAAKAGNQHIFFTVNSSYYLMSDTGWLKLNSPDELVSIDGQQPVKASAVNLLLKRKQIRRMMPSEDGALSYELYTRQGLQSSMQFMLGSDVVQ